MKNADSIKVVQIATKNQHNVNFGMAPIILVVLNIFATSSKHLYAYLSEGASVSAPVAAYESALSLFKNTRLGGSIIWINAEGVTLDELGQLEKQWLPVAGKAIMLMGSNDIPVVNRSLQGLMAARRDNPAFVAVVLTPGDTAAAVTTRLIASQSAGWLHHEVKNTQNPQVNLNKLLALLSLTSAASPYVDVPSGPAVLAAAPLIPIHKAKIIAAVPVAVVSEKPHSGAAGGSPQNSATAVQSDLAVLHSSTSTLKSTEGHPLMTTLNDSMNACMQIDGAMAAALVDFSSGMALAKVGAGINLDAAAAGNSEVIKSKMKTMAALGLKDNIEDMLITLSSQYHLIRPVPHKQGLFLYMVLDKTKSNLAMARYKLMEIEKTIAV